MLALGLMRGWEICMDNEHGETFSFLDIEENKTEAIYDNNLNSLLAKIIFLSTHVGED